MPSVPSVRFRLLIVEDEPSIGTALSRLLSRWEFVPVVVRTAEEALAVLADEPVDLVLLDYRIGRVRGDELFHSIERAYPHLRAKVLFMTGDYEEASLRNIEATGCPFVLKPFEVGFLVDQLLALAMPPAPAKPAHDDAEHRSGHSPPRSA